MQVVFYTAWGCILGAQALLTSSYSGSARPALLMAIMNVITSGFIANSVFTQLIESGSHSALIISIQTMPAMGLYRGDHFGETYQELRSFFFFCTYLQTLKVELVVVPAQPT